MYQLEKIVTYGKTEMNNIYRGTMSEFEKFLEANKAEMAIGFGLGIASRFIFKDNTGVLPAIAAGFLRGHKKTGNWSKYLDAASASAGSYYAGYVLTDIVLRAFFQELNAFLPVPACPTDVPPVEPPTTPTQPPKPDSWV